MHACSHIIDYTNAISIALILLLILIICTRMNGYGWIWIIVECIVFLVILTKLNVILSLIIFIESHQHPSIDS